MKHVWSMSWIFATPRCIYCDTKASRKTTATCSERHRFTSV